MAFLELRNVSRSITSRGVRISILENVNLRVAKGEFVALLGYSGCGKSTLISLLAGLIRPDRGEVLMDGHTVLGPGPDRGVVFQNYSLLPWLTVRENVRLAVDAVYPTMSVAERDAHAERFIAMVHLTDASAKRPRELSGGMRQRVAIARTLAMEPRVLLMDEPLSALDALTRATLQDEIVGIWERARQTAVLITNDIDEAILLADRIIPLTSGPGATLGPEFAVSIPRPRDRRTIARDALFRKLKLDITRYLLSPACRSADEVMDAATEVVA